MKKLIVTFAAALALAVGFTATAAAPQGYYNSLEGKSSGDLKTAVYQLVHNFTKVTSYQDLPRYFQQTDVYPQSSRWWDMYSDIPLYAPSFKGLNREHSFPKSWWGGLTGIPAYVDLNHLYPSEQAANMAKSNYPLGVVDRTEATRFDNGISTVGYPVTGQGGGCQWVFEPADEYKGDFARTYFYMVTCYQDLKWEPKYMYMMSQNTFPTLNGWAARLLMEWHRADGVSQKEIDRNEAVYRIQNNRNPFIDHPELAEYIWGDKVGEPFTLSSTGPVGDPVLTTPIQGMSLDFGQVAIGSEVTSELFFKGENLRGSLDLVITGTNRSYFSIPSSLLSTSLVNSADGTWLKITYKPAELGQHTARLIISEGGMAGGSRGVILRGECLPVPTLTACTALPASDITSTGYVANWTYPENETIDYWIVTRNMFRGNTFTTEEILAEGPGVLIEGFDANDSESYSVQSVRLGHRSPASNLITVDHSGAIDAEMEYGLVVQGFEGCLRFLVAGPQTGARIFDTTGREIMVIEEIRNNMDVEMLPGVYIVVTDQNRTPHKVVVR